MVDLAQGPVDHRPDFCSQSTVDHGQEQWLELAGVQLVGIPVCRTSLQRRGKQEEGTGISTPVGTIRWRGSDSRATVD
jgi:hypothetical protein